MEIKNKIKNLLYIHISDLYISLRSLFRKILHHFNVSWSSIRTKHERFVEEQRVIDFAHSKSKDQYREKVGGHSYCQHAIVCSDTEN